MIAIPVTSAVAEVREAAMKSGHSRIPAYEETVDNILGLLHVKDLARASADAEAEADPVRSHSGTYWLREPSNGSGGGRTYSQVFGDAARGVLTADERVVVLTLARLGLVSLVILPATILMGGTLPVFCRQFVSSPLRIAWPSASLLK